MPEGPTAERRRAVVAIDGPSASGKSTVARAVASRLGFQYVDTGAMYRSVGLAALRAGLDLGDAQALERLVSTLVIDSVVGPGGDRILLNGEDVTEAIRTPEVSTASSLVSAAPGVRDALVAMQRQRAARGGVVMEGRDIGTVVLPDAEVKVFLRASVEVRARRRHAELRARGSDIAFDDVLRQEAERDQRDETRAHSPLRPADDAVVVDTTALTVDEVTDLIIGILEHRTATS